MCHCLAQAVFPCRDSSKHCLFQAEVAHARSHKFHRGSHYGLITSCSLLAISRGRRSGSGSRPDAFRQPGGRPVPAAASISAAAVSHLRVCHLPAGRCSSVRPAGSAPATRTSAQAWSPSRPWPVILARGCPPLSMAFGKGQDLGRILAGAAVAVRHAHAQAQACAGPASGGTTSAASPWDRRNRWCPSPRAWASWSGADRPKGPTSRASGPISPAPSSGSTGSQTELSPRKPQP